jgi:hypothetical protein
MIDLIDKNTTCTENSETMIKLILNNTSDH